MSTGKSVLRRGPFGPPWMIPSPARTSSWTPLYSRHAELNVEVALGEVGAFGMRSTSEDPDSIILSDLQDVPDFSTQGRLGSGRTGFYKTKYLKGVGRTALAGNWADADDALHHSGVLPASGAIRELIVSVYLESEGAGATVNGCEGLLLKPLPEGVTASQPAPLDTKLQGLTVKNSNFCRFSNLLWLANHLDLYRIGSDTTTSVVQFFGSFLECVSPESSPSEARPHLLAEALFRRAEDSLEVMRRFWTAGISWGSAHNNYAIDGRFLDLDLPVIIGAPLVGVLANEQVNFLKGLSPRGLFEVLDLIRHVRTFVHAFRGRLQALGEMGHPVSANESNFALSMAASLANIAADHLFFSADAVTAMLLDWVESAVDMTAAQRRELTATVGGTVDLFMNRQSGAPRPLDVHLRPEPSFNLASFGGLTPVAHVFTGHEAPRMTEKAKFVNERLHTLDELRGIEEVLKLVEHTVSQLNVSQAPHAPVPAASSTQ